MYEHYWGLRRSPFANSAERGYFFESQTHEEALARLQFLFDRRRRLGLLLGDVGAGKTRLLEECAVRRRRENAPVAHASLRTPWTREFLFQLAEQWELAPAESVTDFALWRLLCDRLASFRCEGRHPVLLADDAHAANPETLELMQRLAALDSASFPLTLVLALPPQDIARLGRDLLDLAELRIDLEPWTEEETQTYLHASLARAGRGTPIFEAKAASRLHHLAHGLPRHVARLADLALLAGAGKRIGKVDAATVESVFHELSTVEV